MKLKNDYRTYEEKHKAFNRKIAIMAVVIILGTCFFAWLGVTMLVYPYLSSSLQNLYTIEKEEYIVMPDSEQTFKIHELKAYSFEQKHILYLIAAMIGITIICDVCVVMIMMLYKTNSFDTHLKDMGIKAKTIIVELMKEDIERDKIKEAKTEKDWKDFQKWQKEVNIIKS